MGPIAALGPIAMGLMGPIAAGTVVVVCEPTRDVVAGPEPDAAGVNLTPPGPGSFTATFLCITVGTWMMPFSLSATFLCITGGGVDGAVVVGAEPVAVGAESLCPLEPFAAAGPIAAAGGRDAAAGGRDGVAGADAEGLPLPQGEV